SVYQEYFERVGEIVNATVRNIDGRTQNVVLSLGKAEAVLPRSEQIPGEHYRVGQRLRVYLLSVERTPRGPQITVSRAHRDLLRRLLELEVPEIYNGVVEVKSIAREPGFRSKVAVAALQPGVDPVGSCVGMRGVRIQNIVNELGGEKIDVVAWSSDERTFIANALSPAKVVAVYLNPLEKAAKVIVPDHALSLAIGKEGQNARLAAKLTGWRIDIKSESEAAAEADQLKAEMEEAMRRVRE
ncbi:MAG: transcription termination/antitermination protein NusA, partial [Chloroflexi bacterium]|nr:transcription termination/antitermination protein NusA [Chloroflexota bacterium]